MKIYKIVSVLILLVIFCSISSSVFAAHSAGEIISEGQHFIQAGGKGRIDEGKLINMSDTVYNILLSVGIIAALVVGLVIGIKFVIGGVEQKAEIKGLLIPYIIGLVVLFGAFAIWKIIVDILQTM